MSGKLRIKDIARQLGVSPATVSRALRNSEIVAEPTRSRIREMAEQLNYRPNINARNLRTHKSMAILMVVRDIGNPFYLEILKGVEATARAAGYSVLMGNTEDDPKREDEYFNMLQDGHADGMIMMTGKLSEKGRDHASSSESPSVVVALEMIEDTPFPHVQIDNHSAAQEAVQHLIDLGHKKIAHICGPLPEVMSKLRLEGYRSAIKKAGLEISEGYEQRGDFTLASGEECCSNLMKLPNPPTAVFSANDEMAFGAINKLRQNGLDVPKDVSVVGFDNLYFSKAFNPPLTTVSQPRDLIGQKAMAMLLEIMAGRTLDESTIMLPTKLLVRGSTAVPPAG